MSQAFVPGCVIKSQDHQKTKLADDFKNRSVFSERKIEVEVVNKPIAKKISPVEIQEVKSEMSLEFGAFLSPFVMQRQEHHRVKNEVIHKEIKLMSAVEPEPEPVIVPVIKKKLPPIIFQEEKEKFEMIWSSGAYMATATIKRQECDQLKIGDILKVIKNPADIKPIIVEEKPNVYSNKVRNFTFRVPSSQKLLPPDAVMVNETQILKRGQPVDVLGDPIGNPIGQEFLADCGMSTSWVFKCAPWHELATCQENKSFGAWVPFIVLYQVEYYECLFVKEQIGHGREFSQDHGKAYK